MSGQKKKKSANAMFNVLNNELGGKSKKKSSGKRSTASKKTSTKKSGAKKSKNQSKSADSAGLGCVKIFVFFVTALVLAWVIFMPSHSLGELTEYLSAGFSQFTEQIHNSDTQAETVASAEQQTATTTTTITTTATSTTSKPTSTTTKKVSTTTASTVHYVDSPDSAEPDNIKVYLKSQLVVIYDNEGGVIKAFTCSSGKSSTPTRTGDYAIHHQYRWRLMIGDSYAQYASAFSGSYLFHSIPYNKQDASTMSNAAYDKLGTGASAGCIRLCCRDAKWIYDNCKVGTKVKVINEAAPNGIEGEKIPARIKKNKYSGWDPTDPAAENPYNNT